MLALAGLTLSAFVIWQFERRRRAFAQLARQAGAEPRWFDAVGVADGVEYRLQRSLQQSFPHYSSGLQTYRITLFGRSALKFHITRQQNRTQFFARLLHRARPIQTGDVEFDRSYRVSGQPPTALMALLMSGDQKDTVRRLFELGVTELVLDERALEARWTDIPLHVQLSSAVVRPAVRQLAALVAVLPGFADSRISLRNSRVRRRRLATMTAAFASLIVGIATTLVGLTRFAPVDADQMWFAALPIALASLSAFLIFVAASRSTTPYTRHELIVIVASAVLGFPSGAVGLLLIGNGLGDPGAVTSHRVPIVKKYVITSDLYGLHSQHTVRVRPWREGQPDVSVDISAELYNVVVPGRTELIIDTKPGNLGLEWIAAVTEAP